MSYSEETDILGNGRIMSEACDSVDEEEAEVIMMTAAEFRAAGDAGLRSVGLTYEELADQARSREFVSARAHKLWVAIGGTR